MFACDLLMLGGPGNEAFVIKSGLKRASGKAHQSPLFMIIAEVKKKKNEKQNKMTKYESKHLMDGTHWFWSGTHFFFHGVCSRDSLMANCNKITVDGKVKHKIHLRWKIFLFRRL